MTPERWQRVKELFEAALEREAGERGAFLERACDGDESLRGEVETLVASYERDETFLETPAVAAAADSLLNEAARPPLAGSTGHYQVVREIGRGGMGEVYLARDPRLGRQVALKLLPAVFAADRHRMRRFEQEARAASALNHPNVCVVYEVGTTGSGQRFIVMEYIEGETLRARLAREAIGVGEALSIARQVALATEAAHERGIVHRDIKPENVMLRPDGYAKVLDFGLAKLTGPFGGAQGADPAAPTSAPVTTEAGAVVGTASYMSPEQAQGLQVDERSDVFSFGAVLYEMLAGRQAFGGESAVDTLHAIIHDDPPRLSDVRPDVPPGLERVVARCLQKRPQDRFQTGRELAAALEPIEVSSSATRAPALASHPRLRPGSMRVVWAAASLALVLAAAVTAYLYRAGSRLAPPTRTVPLTSLAGEETDPAFSPDESRIAFCWSGERGEDPGVYVQVIGAGRPGRVAGGPGSYHTPAWSPDGRYIAFIRYSESGGGLFLVPATGGPERKLHALAESNAMTPAGVDWSEDGERVFFPYRSTTQPAFAVYSVSVTDSAESQVTSPSDPIPGDASPRVSPDGLTLAFVRTITPGGMDIFLQPLAGGEPDRLTFDNTWISAMAWAADGREIIFSSARRGGSRLWRVQASGGTPEPVAAGGDSTAGVALSRSGSRLAYAHDVSDSDIWRTELPTSPGRLALPAPFVVSSRGDSVEQYSPDGTRLVFWSDRSGSPEHWVCDGEGRDAVQLTHFGGPVTGTGRWSPDGQQIVCDARPYGAGDIFVIDADTGAVRRMTANPAEDTLPSWSRDGRWIYFMSTRTGAPQIWKMPAEGGEAVQLTRHEGLTSCESPDGRILYYKKPRTAGIWSVPVEGGEESPLGDGIRTSRLWSWVVTARGIYFLDFEAEPGPALRFFDYATRRVTRIALLERAAGGISVSPDGRRLLYDRLDHSGSDIMLVEPWD